MIDTNDNNNWLVDDATTIDNIIEAISQLPDKYKYVLMLFLIEGYDHEEISQVLNITQVASRTQLSRGKLKLQELLKHNNYGERY